MTNATDKVKLAIDTAIGLYQADLIGCSPLVTALKKTRAARASYLISRAACFPVLLVADKQSVSALAKHKIPFMLCQSDVMQLTGKSVDKFFASGLNNVFRYSFLSDPHYLRNDRKYIVAVPDGLQPLDRATARRRIDWLRNS